ncbi:protein of unknown function [Maridesulfovibrio hydrothermalis AM13 = DSM 14728]|uniref:Uncharacterized protein n=2 Tax=Maridesulfovibrio TaxID=2794998 RepID=L0R6F8_9BACT|nr:protein of unknown function [Maridesulfovibrio hydrothermalis AM13 = DSM 14728]
MNNVNENKTVYAGRLIDQTGVGLRMLLGEQLPGPDCLYACLTGRPFQYRVAENPDGWFTPYLPFVNAIQHAIDALGIREHTYLKKIDNLTIIKDEYSNILEKFLMYGPVLIGPFKGKVFENEFIHAFRDEPTHCLLCVSSVNSEYLLLHPDGQLLVMSIEQILNLHKHSDTASSLVLAVNTLNIKSAPQIAPSLALLSGAEIVSDTTDTFGPAAFLKVLIEKNVNKEINIISEIKFKLGISEISISIHMINELVMLFEQSRNSNDPVKYKIRSLVSALTDLQEKSVALLSLPTDKLCNHDNWLSEFSKSWERYERTLINLLPHNRENMII